MQSHWHMHVSKEASAVAVGTPLGNVMGLHCLLQSQATVTLHAEKSAKQISHSASNCNSSNEDGPASAAASTLNGGTAAGDMYACIVSTITSIIIRTIEFHLHT
jgi:hypothetical protein